MTFSPDEQKAFIKDVEAAYDSMRTVYGREKQADGLRRCHSRCASGCFEDLFAGLIYDHLPQRKSYVVFVDCPIRMDKENPRYFDFVLCRKLGENSYEICYIAELKTNSGFFRDGIRDVAGKVWKDVDCLKTHVLTASGGADKFRCARNMKFDLVMYSAGSNKKETVQEAYRTLNANRNALTKLIILCDPSNDKSVRQIARNADFKLMAERITSTL